MSERAIKKLKWKFIWAATGVLIVTMLMVAGFLYLGNMIMNRETIRTTLEYIADNNGELISWNEEDGKEENKRIINRLFSFNSEFQSSEFQFSTRYFAVLYDEDQRVEEIKTSYISEISQEEALDYGQRALDSYFDFGRFDNYYYHVKDNSDGSSIVVYIDRQDILYSNNRLLYLALILIGFGMFVAFFAVRVIATQVIKNEVRNAELQKQFMTNASHELKTPLAVIRANTEMEEILSGENEWTQSTLRQIERLNGLIQNLVMITRAEENQAQEGAQKINVTKTLRETVENFRSVAVSNDKKVEESIQENVFMTAQDAQIRQLASLLLDNAIKYCDEGGVIQINLTQRGKGILLTISNSYAEGGEVDYSKFFERFYREDASHNTDRGGYGIGLSIAESLVRQYRGSINVNWKNGIISFVCQLRSI